MTSWLTACVKRVAGCRSFILDQKKILVHQLVEHRLGVCQGGLPRIDRLRGLRSEISTDRAGGFQQKLRLYRKRVDATDNRSLEIYR